MTASELRAIAEELGFDGVGAAPAEPYASTEEAIRDRRGRGLFADMRFTMAQPERSCHPETLLENAKEAGIDDLERIFTTDDLAPGEVIVTATGVSNGDLLRGVRYLADSARTHSLLMCTRCNWVRFVDGIHFFARERREEVRLLGSPS